MSWIKLREIKDWADKYVVESPSEVFFYRPYISDAQTLMILDLLERLKPTKCLEWGAGWSTIFFPRFFPSATWVSIEHLRQFYLMLSPHLPLNATIICEEIWGNYVTRAIKEQPVDFVFVDGERREECIIVASTILRDGGLVVMHNAGDQDIPIKFHEEDVRLRFQEHGRIMDLWWARK